MKTPVAVFTVLILIGSTALGGPETLVKQRAKDLRDNLNAQQGAPPPQQTPSAAQPPVQQPCTPAAPAEPPALTRLRSDLAALNLKADATPERKQRLARDLAAAAQGPDQLTTNTASKLAEDLAQVVGDKNLSAVQRLRLSKDIYAVLNSATTPQKDVDNSISDAQAVFQSCGVARADVLAVAQDLKAAAEVRKNTTK